MFFQTFYLTLVKDLNLKIDHIFIITLPHRKDRLYKLTSQLDFFDLEYEIFYGVNGKKIKAKYESDNMNVGCTASHGQVLQRASIMGLDNCLVLEDDCELSDNFLEQLQNLELPEDWNVCYLSGSHKEKPIKVNDTISRCVKTLTTHAYLIRNSFTRSGVVHTLSLFLNDWIGGFQQPVDGYFADLQNKGNEFNFYVLNKPAAWQRGGFSEINQRDMYYEWLKEELC